MAASSSRSRSEVERASHATHPWRDGRVAEGGGLEIRCGGNSTGGSNPSLSARELWCLRGRRRRHTAGSRGKNRGEMPERLKGHDWKSCVPPKGVPWVQIPLSPPLRCDGPSQSAPRRVVAGPRAMEFRETRQVRKEAAVAGDFMCRGSSGCHPWRGGARSFLEVVGVSTAFAEGWRPRRRIDRTLGESHPRGWEP